MVRSLKAKVVEKIFHRRVLESGAAMSEAVWSEVEWPSGSVS